MSLDWSEIELEVDDVARSVFRTWHLSTADVDDLKQEALRILYERTISDRELEGRLAHPSVRRKFIGTCLRFSASALKRCAASKRYLGSYVAVNAESSSTEASEIVAILRERLSGDTNAILALDVLSGSQTLLHYAAEEKVSLRTSQRRFVHGITRLRCVLESIGIE